MNSSEFKNTVCRICLDKNVVLDWSNTLVEYNNITYEDCYYKYTQLKPLVDDPFSSMLCQNCLNRLEDVHTLILKALDSHNFLLEVNCINSEMDDSSVNEDDANYISTDFETILVEKTDTESEIEDQYEYEIFDEFIKNASSVNDDNNYKKYTTLDTQMEESFDMKDEYEEFNIVETSQLDNTKDKETKTSKVLCRKSKRIHSSKSLQESATFDNDNCNKKFKTGNNKVTQSRKLENKSVNNKVQNSGSSKARKAKAKAKTENIPCMCSYCSKILHNKYALQKHEKIHTVNRERKAACPICGVKFFEEAYVKTHMHIHNENRVKKHKCEFCDKAFFEKGGLNVHRRIHLGLMIPCSLCSKEFFRKVDLDIHMNSHSATLINAETKKRSRYWVRCKYCNKNVMSTSFKSHTAVHLNEPLMKCSICNKEFFRRDSCTQHLKSIHQKTTEEYNDFIVLYSKNRLSHLYLEQTTEIQVNED